MDISALPAIPSLASVDGWKNVLIAECGEPLVQLSDPRIEVDPQYFLQLQRGAINGCFVRKRVAEMLLRAAKELPKGRKLVILDAWRPVIVQQQLFESIRERLHRLHSDWNGETLEMESQKYVSLPSVDISRPSPHLTGGAIDVTIKEDSGAYLDMGTMFDEFSERSHTRYYEQKLESGARLSEREIHHLRNRRLLYHLLSSSGFTNYSAEWWHFDFGNQFWGKITNAHAIYGKTEPPDRMISQTSP